MKSKSRNPLLAALLAFFIFGAGQLYLGKGKRALYIGTLSLVFFLFILGFFGVFQSFTGLCVFASLVLISKIGFAIWAYLSAKRSNTFEMRWYNRFHYYLLFSTLFFLFGLLMKHVNQEVHHFESFKVPTESMAPSIFPESIIMTDTHPQRFQKGDIVAFNVPEGYIGLSRIMAIGGDSIGVENGLVSYGKSVQEELLGQTSFNANGGLQFGELVLLPNNRQITISRFNPYKISDGVSTPLQFIPQGAVFLVSDNRFMSYDSRRFGSISLDDIVGKVRFICWGASAEQIGKNLEFD
jgi:signal peptidase I